MPAPTGLKRNTLEAYNDFMEATIGQEVKDALQQRALENQESVSAECTPYIMLYARGTTEGMYLMTILVSKVRFLEFNLTLLYLLVGELGATVGPALKAGLASDKNWSVRGIGSRDGYDASLAGIYCIGMDGGMACKGILEKMVAQCPNSKFVTAGYSQGAMVARICVAYASDPAKANVLGVCSAPPF